MYQMGKVVETEGDFATVRFVRSAACKNCGACLYIGEKEAQITVRNNLNADVGDEVSVELHAKSFLQAGLIAYVMPLVLLLTGLFIGARFGDVMGVTLALASVGVSYLLLRALEPRLKKSKRFKPRMTGFIQQNNTKGEENG